MIKKKSDERRYPRIGKIRIGKKTVSRNGKEIPTSVDYFIPDSRFANLFTEVYGDKPKEIDIVFPPIPQGGDVDTIFDHYYRMYKGGGHGKPGRLFCRGNGETAIRSDGKGTMVEGQQCPCDYLESGECSERLKLTFMIPSVPVVGVWAFETSSRNTRLNLASGLDMTRIFAGNVCGIPMKLRVEIQEGAVYGSANRFPVVSIIPAVTTDQLLQVSGKSISETYKMLNQPKSNAPEIEHKQQDEKLEAATMRNVVIDADDLPEKVLKKESQEDIVTMSRGELIEAIRKEHENMQLTPAQIRKRLEDKLGSPMFSDAKDIDLRAYYDQLQEEENV